MSRDVLLSVGKRERILLSCRAAKDAVDKCALALIFRKLNRLGDGGEIGYCTHVQKLTKPEAQNIPDSWCYLVDAAAREVADIIVVGYLMLHRGVKEGRNDGLILSGECVGQVGGDSQIRVLASLLYIAKETESNFSLCHYSKTSPTASFLPRRRSPALILPLPSGMTESTLSAPSPQATVK